MKANSINAIRKAMNNFVRLNLTILFLLSIAVTALPQSDQERQQNTPASQQAKAREYLGPTADSIQPYKPAGRDPFKKYIKPKAQGPSKIPRPVGFPTLDVRRAEFRQKVDQARARDLAEPDPVSQYLVSELDVTGIFRDEQGFGVFVRAQPTGTMFFIRRGTRCYNGEVLRIEGDESEMGASRVLFREVSYLEVNGKQSPQERVVAKVPAAQK